ncbi:MAG: SymE family type I addiction module toxin [Butyrivibrio hungatei]|nr:SymE family type I addiction module toxin [Butyrivibrio hungatei]
MRKELKKNRALTVHYTWSKPSEQYWLGRKQVQRPAITLSGAWLEALGFNVGDKIDVACEEGKLTITKQEASKPIGYGR